MSSLPAHVWINGRVLPTLEARVSPFDQGLTLGLGVFETLVNRGAGPVALHRHWLRLEHACHVLQLTTPSEEVMRAAFAEVMQANGVTEARLRFTVTRGDTPNNQTMIAVATPLVAWGATEDVVVAPWKRNLHSPLLGIKSSAYAENLLALEHARRAGAGEAILANTNDELCEGSATNVFIVEAGTIVTPPLASGCLPGVTRELVLEACKQAGLPFEQRPVPLDAFLAADEAFLTSSTRDVHPIARINGRMLHRTPGRLTEDVKLAYLALAAAER